MKKGVESANSFFFFSYVLCNSKVKDKLVSMIKKVSEEFFGLEAEKSSDLCRIISDRHYQRLVNLIKTTKGDIVKEGKCIADERFVDLHVIANVSLDDPVMQEELFGPILPIVTVESVKEAIDVIKSRPKPLSMYIFTENKGKMKELIEVSENFFVKISQSI